MSQQGPFRVAFVPGVTPGKWLGIWKERMRSPVVPIPVQDDDQLAVLQEERAEMCFLRLPVERDGLHVISLYREAPVVAVPPEHLLTALDEVTMTDLADLADPGVVVVPMSLARLHARKDLTTLPVVDAPEYQVGLAWRTDLEDPRTETFVGIVRGRTVRSSRG